MSNLLHLRARPYLALVAGTRDETSLLSTDGLDCDCRLLTVKMECRNCCGSGAHGYRLRAPGVRHRLRRCLRAYRPLVVPFETCVQNLCYDGCRRRGRGARNGDGRSIDGIGLLLEERFGDGGCVVKSGETLGEGRAIVAFTPVAFLVEYGLVDDFGEKNVEISLFPDQGVRRRIWRGSILSRLLLQVLPTSNESPSLKCSTPNSWSRITPHPR